jgi:hypothetical protein
MIYFVPKNPILYIYNNENEKKENTKLAIKYLEIELAHIFDRENFFLYK